MGRIGIYGGTFNPPHMGHMEAARQAIRLLDLDKLLLIPDRQPPHKEIGEGDPSAWDRLELVRLAAEDIPGVEVSDLELHREGKSYTSDTVTELSSLYPNDELILLMGTDMFLSFHTWHEPETICKYASLAVMLRDPSDRKQLEAMQIQAQKIRKELGGKVTLLQNEILSMSSTNVRRMITFRAEADMVPEKAMNIIREKKLYGLAKDLKNLPMEDLRREATALLDPKRVPHVLGCAETARYLAEKYGENPVDAERAGLLHDVTKALPPELQLQVCREYGVALDDFSRQNPKTLHAATGAEVARRIFGENDAVYTAIHSHTTGCRNMNTLQKIIYIADYMEPNRDFPGVEELRSATERDLDEAVLMGLEMTVDMLRSQGRRVCADSLEAIEWFRENKLTSDRRD